MTGKQVDDALAALRGTIERLESALRDERRPWYDINDLGQQWHDAGRPGTFEHNVRPLDGLCLPCGIVHWKPGREPITPGEKIMRYSFLHPDVSWTDEWAMSLAVSVEWRGSLMAKEEWVVTRPGRNILGFGGQWDTEAGDHSDLWYSMHRFPLNEARRLAHHAAIDLYIAWKARQDRQNRLMDGRSTGEVR